jgi:hypothetical protein
MVLNDQPRNPKAAGIDRYGQRNHIVIRKYIFRMQRSHGLSSLTARSIIALCPVAGRQVGCRGLPLPVGDRILLWRADWAAQSGALNYAYYSTGCLGYRGVASELSLQRPADKGPSKSGIERLGARLLALLFPEMRDALYKSPIGHQKEARRSRCRQVLDPLPSR